MSISTLHSVLFPLPSNPASASSSRVRELAARGAWDELGAAKLLPPPVQSALAALLLEAAEGPDR